jgi:4-hydroxy-tetrahydrodipicolinate synthase
MSASPAAPFGRMLTAMVTPFAPGGSLDLDGAQRLAEHLVAAGNDGLVVNGTTGESPTTSDAEKDAVLRSVLEAVGDRATVVAGVGSNDTRHTCALAQAAEKAGAHGLLAVTPYYNKPPQAGLLAHFRALADSTELPVMMYDIPGRSGVPIEPDTMVALAEHPRIAAVKDAKGDLAAASSVLARSDLAWYSGEDILNLPLLSIGACGFVSVVGHLVADRLAAMIEAYLGGDVAAAARLHRGLLPVYAGVFRTQGVITTKAALADLGLPAGPVRLPLVDATEDQRAVLRADLAAGEVAGFSADS